MIELGTGDFTMDEYHTCFADKQKLSHLEVVNHLFRMKYLAL